MSNQLIFAGSADPNAVPMQITLGDVTNANGDTVSSAVSITVTRSAHGASPDPAQAASFSNAAPYVFEVTNGDTVALSFDSKTTTDFTATVAQNTGSGFEAQTKVNAVASAEGIAIQSSGSVFLSARPIERMNVSGNAVSLPTQFTYWSTPVPQKPKPKKLRGLTIEQGHLSSDTKGSIYVVMACQRAAEVDWSYEGLMKNPKWPAPADRVASLFTPLDGSTIDIIGNNILYADNTITRINEGCRWYKNRVFPCFSMS